MNETAVVGETNSMRDRLRSLLNHSVVRKGASLAFLLYLSPIVGMILEITLIRVFSAGAVLDSFRALMTFMLMVFDICMTL